jgi:glycerophosphoryl diester phosphodiesterase
VPLVFLTGGSGGPFGDSRTYAEYLTPAGLRELSAYVDALGPEKSQVVARNSDGTLGAPTGLVGRAHGAGLQVIPYTFRAENQFLPADYRVGTEAAGYGRALDEQIAFLRAGVDGLFTDQPDVAVLARELARV